MKKSFLLLSIFLTSILMLKADLCQPVKIQDLPSSYEITLGEIPLFRNSIDSISNILSNDLLCKAVAEADSIVEIQESVISNAKKHIGVRYRYGRMNPKSGFDCSGFTKYVFSKFDIDLPRVSGEQFFHGMEIEDKHDLQVGDLVFFSGRRISKRIGHVGIVTEIDPKTGNFSFIHASCNSGITITESTSSYYTRRFLKACRVIGI